MNLKFFTLTFLLSFMLYSQNKTEKIIIAKYDMYPYSAEFFENDSNDNKDKQSFSIALRKTKEFKYTFITDLQSQKNVFYLGSIITKPIKGKEEYWIKPENVISYTFLKDKMFYKKETLFDNDFYSKTKIKDANKLLHWEITKETKIISNYKCTKAVSNFKGNKIITWFTTEIPIKNNPLNLQGLPGFIMEAETFFNTLKITSLQTKTIDNFNQLISKFNKEIEAQDQIKESVLLLKKGRLIAQLKMMRQ